MVTNKMVSLYEKYKTEWMLERGITTDEFIRVLDNFRIEQGQDGVEFSSIENIVNSFEADSNGFDGEIWACFNEWQDEEFFEELCDRVRDKVHIDLGEKTEHLIFHTPVDGHEDVVLYTDESHDDWCEIIAEFILYGDYATNKEDESEKFRTVLITWLWLNDEKENAY